jgi:SAM-dependent methyltransferase
LALDCERRGTVNGAFLHRDCPLCRAQPPSSPKVCSRPAAESLSFEDLVGHWNGFFTERMFFSYARCRSCGLLYTPTFFEEAQLEALYAQMPANMALVPTDALRRTQRGYFETLKAHSDLEGGYIEIGPDVGLFTENCVREGRFDPYWLIEPNRDVTPALSATMGSVPFHITHDMTGYGYIPDASAGAVVMIQVLDHLLDPAAALRELRAKLRPGGKLLVVTHDESSILRRVFGPRWPAFCLQHPQIYNPTSMKALVEAAGYRLVDIQRTTNYFPVAFLLKSLLWASGLQFDKTPSFGGVSVGLKLGNMITLATLP